MTCLKASHCSRVETFIPIQRIHNRIAGVEDDIRPRVKILDMLQSRRKASGDIFRWGQVDIGDMGDPEHMFCFRAGWRRQPHELRLAESRNGVPIAAAPVALRKLRREIFVFI